MHQLILDRPVVDFLRLRPRRDEERSAGSSHDRGRAVRATRLVIPRAALEEAVLDPAEVYLTNAVKHR
jgi:hypothetical protein